MRYHGEVGIEFIPHLLISFEVGYGYVILGSAATSQTDPCLSVPLCFPCWQ